jgi:hypothetical protein
LTKGGLATSGDREIVALIAYLQRLGRDVTTPPAPAVVTVSDRPTVSGGQ